jgi:uncharacterized coiled-coil protein SlyX
MTLPATPEVSHQTCQQQATFNKKMKIKNMTTSQSRNSISRSLRRLSFILIPVLFACFALSPMAQAKQPTPTPTPPGEDRGNGNTAAENVQALESLTTGTDNTATGWQSLFNNTEGNDNTANGFQALYGNTTGFANTATGILALASNTTGIGNTANGSGALVLNTTGFSNTANGLNALFSNTTGAANTANGDGALFFNATGNLNTANGFDALYGNTTGFSNTANGLNALYNNTTGNDNTADGVNALYDATTGSDNIALGFSAGFYLTTGDNNIDIGNLGVADESSTIRIGNPNQTRTFIAGIRDATTENADAITVVIDSAGQLGTVSSSRRFKKEIKPMDQASEAILALKPVTFHYKSDNTNTPQFGLIAEEVADVNPDLVVRDADGEIYTVRYEAVNAMLLNEFLKEHRKVQEQEGTIAQLKTAIARQDTIIVQQQKGMEVLSAQLKEQASQIQRVSAQIAVSKSAPQTVRKDQ